VDQLLSNLRKLAEEERRTDDVPAATVLSAQDREDIAGALLGSAVGVPARASVAAPRPAWALAARRWTVVVLPLAAAASLFFVLHGAPTSREDGVSLPAYGLSVQGGAKELRGPTAAEGSPQRVMPGTELVLLARPDETVQGAVAARVFLVEDATVRELSADARVSSSGSLEIRVIPWRAGEEPPRPQALIRAAIGRPASLASVSAAAVPKTPVDSSSVRWLAVPVVGLAP